MASTLYRALSDDVTKYTYVDFCAGAGGPTPFIEKDLNSQLFSATHEEAGANPTSTNGLTPRTATTRKAPINKGNVKFVLTDIHPHIPDWTEATKRSDNLSYMAESVDAANAPASLNGNAEQKIFRLYNLAFHHFDDELGSAILKNTIETADGFG